MDVSLVIPVFNEAPNIQRLGEKIRSAMSHIQYWEAIFVDDGSVDRSIEEISKLVDADPEQTILIKLDKNYGQTSAMAAGMRRAKYPFIMTLDADLQNDPADFETLRKKMGDGVGCVCGVRINRKDNKLRLISSKIANSVRNWVIQESISDTGCTLKLFRKECVDGIKFFDGMHRFLPTLCKLEGYDVIEVPVRHHPRFKGQSKYGIKNRIFRTFIDLFAVRWMKKRHLKFQIKK